MTTTDTNITYYTLPLSGLSCQGCVKKVTKALEDIDGVRIEDIDTQSVSLEALGESTEYPLGQAVTAIEALGYQVGYRHYFTLSGLNCGRCVAKVEAALDEQPTVFSHSVSKTHADIHTSLSLASIIQTIENLGYQVGYQHQLALSGLSCGHCVAKVERALDENDAVFDYQVSKDAATVRTTLSAETLIETIASLGFEATLIDPSQETPSSTEPHQPQTATTEVDQQAETPPRTETSSSHSRMQFVLSGMTCASCVKSVETAISSVDGVANVSVNLAERSAIVKGNASPDAIVEAVKNAGYGAEKVEDDNDRRERQQHQQAAELKNFKRSTIAGLGLGGPIMAWGIVGGSMTIQSSQDQWAWGAVAILTLLLLATGGRHFFANAWQALMHKRATMDTLVALGTGAAWLYSTAVVVAPALFPEQARHVYFEASAMIIGLISLGHAIEARARANTSKALDQLLDLQPPTALVIENGQETERPLDKVKQGMTLRVKPGAKVPVDGEVVEGSSYIDESMLTGEPVPVSKQQGDTLHAGTVNQKGSLTFKATGVGSDTMLARIIDLVREAQSSKPELAKLADRISAVFVPIVVAIALITAAIWYVVGPEPSVSYMLVTATTVLIIACPCALGLATPLSVTAAVGRAAEVGVLIRDADALQTAAKLHTLVFDKTGTLTRGQPEVTHVKAINGDQERLMAIAASLEQHSEHPLAQAIVNYAKAQDLSLPTSNDFNSESGKGIQAQIDRARYFIGNQAWMDAQGIETASHQSDIDAMTQRGETAIYLANADSVQALIGVSDPIRDDAIEAVANLQAQGLEVIMLSGDHPDTANAIGRQLGIDHVIAGVLPDGKSEQIQHLQQQGKRVAMVGDGINDAPALAQADVGVAMGSGSDIAIESAQITLMHQHLGALANAIALSQAAVRNMKQNLFGAFIYNTLGIPVAAGILYPFTGMLLSPVIAGGAMALSSITVVTNANRLRFFKIKSDDK
ncbi:MULTISPECIES: cation transporter [unclassified Salinivibrio]|uniref:cation transporter n=1 Tax=unclassified Salinivibrio TaxID=2636825 RepID=UPI00128D8B0F|nr:MULTISPECIES: heavy metal translocating P-type ATPase [unclassified Salinivibrio]MPS31875.1 heavy metal translocating P-type ATPase [Salinivibrio sp. VYel7]MPX93269.1 heavy metal translocating P-type ATPase [Salinivibrio sp. VYel9]MPX95904.1 heavy metal translocating P-type ATPase [Salinivibrio sp. VYel6]MPX99487.1 heavy metal translocating P-type ATPase [Salinivibrio sp. VYel4]MPY02664.1 heavy metal translocating P-type ATPase [Salinivibrio sp. VYel5]